MKLEIEYSIGSGIIQLLMLATDSSKKEVYSQLQAIVYPLFIKMNEEGLMSTISQTRYPGTNVYFRAGVYRKGRHAWPKQLIVKDEIECTVDIVLTGKNVSFSNKQVDMYLAEKILLGAKL